MTRLAAGGGYAGGGASGRLLAHDVQVLQRMISQAGLGTSTRPLGSSGYDSAPRLQHPERHVQGAK
jgi:hypothetical protein